MRSPDTLTGPEKAKLRRLARDLVEWASREGRYFPWRSPSATEYERIVVEVLLQRTTSTAVSKFYAEFAARYPNWDSLAGASLGDLEQFLRPLGLWRRRAASLVRLAQHASSVGGIFPTDKSERERMPAVGQYVSNAIAVFQHGDPAPLLDVNMARVLERFLRPRRLADIRHDPWLQSAAHWLVRGPNTININWAVLDFGALVCQARNPKCDTCPVRVRCSHFRALVAKTKSRRNAQRQLHRQSN